MKKTYSIGNRFAICRCLLFLLTFYLAAPVKSQPIQWEGNGHYYLVVTGSVSWANAVVLAGESVYENMTGYLATVTSSQENAFVTSLLSPDTSAALIGGTDEVAEGQWKWITGEAFDFINWHTGEPNNQGDEDYLHLNGHIWGPSVSGTWNDGDNVSLDIHHYIVEWGEYSVDTSTVQRAFNPVNGHYYLVVSNNVSWIQALNLASAMAFDGMTGYLATVTSSQENSFISNLLPAGTKVAFLGGSDAESEGDWRWVTGENFDYLNWYAGEPNNQADEDYLNMNGNFWGPVIDGTWNDGDNTSVDIHHFVVEWGSFSAETSSVPRVFNPENGHYYLVVTSNVSWTQARMTASLMVYNGMTGYMATVTSSQENEFVTGLLPGGTKAVFIGGTDQFDEGVWSWNTGEIFNYTNWSLNEPNNENDEDYLYLYGDYFDPEITGTWNDGDNASVDVHHYIVEWGAFSSGTSAVQQIYNPENGHYYQVVTANVTWAQARSAASSMMYDGMNGYLATMTSSQENSFVAGLLPVGAKAAFIGGTDEAVEGQWSWITGEEFNFQNWNTGEPNNQNDEDYLYLTGDFWGPVIEGTWTDGDNSSIHVHHFVVEWGSVNVDTSSMPRVFNPGNGHYYLVVTANVSWTQAEIAASAMEYEGLMGYLATITSSQENTFVANLLPSGTKAAFIGGSDEVAEGQWHWVTGESFNFLNWYTGEPNNQWNEDYLYMYGDFWGPTNSGTWNDGSHASVDVHHYIVEWGGYETTGWLPEPVLNHINGHWYLVVTSSVSWADAMTVAGQSTFNGMTGYLATVTTDQENSFILDQLGPDAINVYLGGTDEASEGFWRWITGESFAYTNWYPGEPNNYGGPENYLVLNGPAHGINAGTWNDGRGMSHSDNNRYVIEWGDYTPDEWLPQPAQNPENGHYYLVVTGNVTWLESVSASMISYNGMTGYLATVTTTQEQEFISGLLPAGSKIVFIGGTDEGSEGTWRWITGESFNFSNWYPGEPNDENNEDYLNMYGAYAGPELTGQWNDGHNSSVDAHHYVIEWGDYETQPFTLDRSYNPANGHWYMVISKPVSWEYARLASQIAYENMTGYLATVTSEQENNFIMNLLDPGAVNIHLGGTDEGSEGAWRWITGESFAFSRWHPSEPNNYGGPENYLILNGPAHGENAGTWNDGRGEQNPDNSHYVIEWGYYDNGDAQIGPAYNAANGHYYLVVTNSVSWWQAVLESRIVFNGMTGYLATVTDVLENQFIEGLLGEGLRYAFLGATDEDAEGTWTWVTGENFNYQNWAFEEPDNHNGHENYLWMRGPYFGDGLGKWEDGHGSQNTHLKNYVIEWGGGFDTLSSFINKPRPDSDGDGITDQEEAEDGTNPYDGASIFRGDIKVVHGVLSISWATVNGRCYRVQLKETGPGQDWEFVSPTICETDEYPEGIESYSVPIDGPVRAGAYRVVWVKE